MAELPRVQDTDFVERAGVIHVATTVNKARCVWREVLERDLGIDGHIEYVTPEGLAPGRLIAAQIKSGESRFAKATSTHVPFYPDEKHRQYWAEYPLPVVLVLHNPVDGETVWVDARESLRVLGNEAAIAVPRNQVLDADGVLRALECAGPLPAGNVDLKSLLREMATLDDRARGLCFLYMFAQGMTDIGSSIYFSIDVVHEVLDVLAADWDPPTVSIGAAEFDFADRYVAFLVRHDLARVDYAAWRQSDLEHQMVGKFIAPLTARGRAVRDAISEADTRLPPSEEPPLQPHSRAIVERFVQMIYNPMGFDEFAVRQRRIELVRSTLA